ncbi:MAG: LCP family protein [Oscillospiraceae bacterium]|jgi:anionic cell wall polymer biosynthesis LytR-Cps2A-Psr (LCP) family protein|nr:LCP family protein [Oscillospiraceae bacterium]
MSKPMKVMRIKRMNPQTYRTQQRAKYLALGLIAVSVVSMILIGTGIVVLDIMRVSHTEDEPAVTGNARNFTEEHALAYVFITVSSEDKTLADTFTLVKFTPRYKGVVIATLPKETAVQNGNWHGTLASAMQQKDAAFAVECLSEYLNYNLNGYAIADDITIQNLIDLFNGITLSIPEDLIAPANGNILYAKGVRNLIGSQTLDVIKYTGWSEKLERYTTVSKIHAALINENLSGGDGDRYTKYFNQIHNVLRGQTDISSVTFERAKEGILFISTLNQSGVCKIIPVNGTFAEDGSFVCDKATLTELKTYFKVD